MNAGQMKSTVMLASKGNAEAFGRLYESLSADAYRFAFSYLHDADDAADAVQNASLNAYKSLKMLKKPESFRSWFFKIVSNESRKILNERKNENSLYAENEDIPDETDGNYSLSQEVKEAMEILSDEDKRIVTLCVVDGFKSKEIAVIVGLKASSVRSRLSRALHSMREFLESEGEK